MKQLKNWKRLGLAHSTLATLFVAYALWAYHFISSSAITFRSKTYFCLFDDAMISMRYAWNLAHGQGLVWNPGERVEGMTNLLMTLVMSVGALFLSKSSAILVVQILGIGFVLVTAIFVYQIAGAIRLSMSARVVATAAVLAYYPLSFWSLMGMETGFLTMLCVAALWMSLHLGPRSRGSVSLGLLLAAMVATRPDAGLPAAIILAFRFWSVFRTNRRWTALRDWAIEPGLFVLAIVVLTLFRLIYYKELVPNTYTLKVAGWPVAERIPNGWLFIKPFLITSRYLLLLPAIAVIVRRDWNRTLLGGFALSIVLYQIWAGGDPWLYWRILVPAVVVLVILTADFLEWVLGRVADDGNLASVMCAAGVFLALAVADQPFARELFLDRRPYTVVEHNEANVKAGVVLAEVADAHGSIGVVTAGTAPYYSGLVGVDFLGKCDRYIARLKPDPNMGFNGLKTTPGHNKYDLHYSIETLQPDVIEIDGWGRDNVSAFVRAHYVRRGLMWVKRGSPYVHWDKLTAL